MTEPLDPKSSRARILWLEQECDRLERELLYWKNGTRILELEADRDGLLGTLRIIGAWLREDDMPPVHDEACGYCDVKRAVFGVLEGRETE